MKYGFYSETAAQKYGSLFYYTDDNSLVEVTTISPSITGDEYKFTDKKFVGKVTKFSHEGKPHNYNIEP